MLSLTFSDMSQSVIGKHSTAKINKLNKKGTMIYISFFDDGTGEFIKQWPNWTGVVPAVDDIVALRFGDDNEEERIYSVRLRVIDGTKPDFIKIFIKKCD